MSATCPNWGNEMLKSCDNDEMQTLDCEPSVSTAISLQNSALNDTSAGHSPTRNLDFATSTTHVSRLQMWKSSGTEKKALVSSKTGISMDRLKPRQRSRQRSENASMKANPSAIDQSLYVSQRPSLQALKKGTLFGRSKFYKMRGPMNECTCNVERTAADKRSSTQTGITGQPVVHVERIEQETESQVRIRLRVYTQPMLKIQSQITGWFPSEMTLKKVDIIPGANREK